MEEHQMFNHSQHGFRSGRSCLSQLLAHFDKAFNKVDIGLILHKLKVLGISHKLGHWLHGFLLWRTQCVIVNGKKSEAQPVESGVPQGSVLGPLLFLVLMGDIDEEVSSSFLSSFADDTRIGHGISSSQDMRQLQTDLEAVYRWSKNDNMEFNLDKFEHVHYKAKNCEEPIPKYNSNNGAPIETKSCVRDLGITMSSNASFTDHISERITALKSKIGWILRTFQTREVLPMLTLWKQLVLCDHDYCSQLWNPDPMGDIQSLELLQQSFIRKIKGMQHLSYWKQLQSLSLYSLERRRERYVSLYT